MKRVIDVFNKYKSTTYNSWNIGTQSVQELFFVIGAFVELFTDFLGCDV